MYDVVAEIFVYGIALVYLVLFVILAQYWLHSMVRAKYKKGSRSKAAGPPSRQVPH